MESMMASGATDSVGSMSHDTDLARMIDSFPIGRAVMLAAAGGSGVDLPALDALLAAANGAYRTVD